MGVHSKFGYLSISGYLYLLRCVKRCVKMTMDLSVCVCVGALVCNLATPVWVSVSLWESLGVVGYRVCLHATVLMGP